MHYLVAFLSFFLLLFTPTFAAAKCPNGTIESLTDKTICYLFSSTKEAYLNAEEICVQKNGHLTSINNVFENVFVREQAQQHFINCTEDDFWIGITDLITPGTWNWLDGGNLTFADWDKAQPKNATNYDCGAVKMQGGAWIADICDNEKPFVCKILNASTTSMTSTTISQASTTTTARPVTISTEAAKTTTKAGIHSCPESWIYFNLTDSCYKVIHKKDWKDAEEACVEEGAHLTSIHSHAENDFITSLIPFVNACNDSNDVWIGLNTENGLHGLYWTDGSPLDFTYWAAGRPTGFYTYYCGLLWYGLACNAAFGSWVDGYCTGKVEYSVCKKPA